jgi:hypothetical protein
MKRLTIAIAGLAMGLALASAVPAGATTTTSKPAGKKAPAARPKKLPSPHIGQVAKDGDFAFTVTSVQCGLTSVGTDPLTETAPAGTQWCVANMTVKNIKSAAQTFSSSNQKAVDGHGNELSADVTALVYLPNGAQSEFATVNPGVSISGQVPFQLPATGKIVKVILHDSLFSGGVTVYNVA